MTKIQKNQIIEMRQMGCTYKHISTTLSLQEGTVKSYCLRATKKELLSSPNQIGKSSCKQCGKEIEQVAKRKKQIFCCKACRQKWWNSHLYLIDRTSKAIYNFYCLICGNTFTSYGKSKRKYCTHECYIKARYHKEPSGGR
ncbi:MAG: RNA polymerase subunit sigma-70 [Spirochaetales bacterium]|nr:RNA polymerase subunit sigma-70 [Spirochaetales bacterium]